MNSNHSLAQTREGMVQEPCLAAQLHGFVLLHVQLSVPFCGSRTWSSSKYDLKCLLPWSLCNIHGSQFILRGCKSFYVSPPFWWSKALSELQILSVKWIIHKVSTRHCQIDITTYQIRKIKADMSLSICRWRVNNMPISILRITIFMYKSLYKWPFCLDFTVWYLKTIYCL